MKVTLTAQEEKREGEKVVKAKREERVIEVTPVLPASLAAANAHHGEKALLSAIHGKIKASASTLVMHLMEKGKSDEEIHNAVREMKLSTGRQKLSDVEKAVKLFKALSKEAQAAIMAEVRK